MGRLSNRVDELEKADGQGRDDSEDRAQAAADAESLKQAIRDYRNGDVNAFQARRDRQAAELTETTGGQPQAAHITEAAAEFRRRIAAMASRA